MTPKPWDTHKVSLTVVPAMVSRPQYREGKPEEPGDSLSRGDRVESPQRLTFMGQSIRKEGAA